MKVKFFGPYWLSLYGQKQSNNSSNTFFIFYILQKKEGHTGLERKVWQIIFFFFAVTIYDIVLKLNSHVQFSATKTEVLLILIINITLT